MRSRARDQRSIGRITMTQTSDGIVISHVTLRYSDMDPMGHLNNAVYATLFEAGRVDYIEEIMKDVTPQGCGYVLVRLAIDFRAEARHPGTVAVSTRLTRMGGSSLAFGQEARIGDKVIASGESVCALFDLAERKAARCPDAMRERAASLIKP
jgi:acyl-CoA thioester hydrolase